jgi:ribosomal-protein-alanine N-acetyltransferase
MQLSTSCLLLREFQPEDCSDVLAYQSDARYLAFTPWNERSAACVQALVDRFVEWQHDEPRLRYQLAVVLAGDSRVIGSCGIRRDDASQPYAELGYELAPACWGRGLATEAARALLEFGFQGLELDRISSRCIGDNLASVAVLERLGFRLQSVLRSNQRFKGRSWDTHVYELSRSGWDVRRQRPASR